MSEITQTDAAEPGREDNQGEPRSKAVTLTEGIVPIAGVAFAIYYLSTIWTMPYEARMGGMVVSTVIFVLTALLVLRWSRDAVRHGVEPGLWSLLGEGSVLYRRLGMVALSIAYVMTLPQIGYFIATLVFLTAAMVVLGVRRPRHLVLIPLLTTCVGHFAFIIVLGISLPVGFIGRLLSPLQDLIGI